MSQPSIVELTTQIVIRISGDPALYSAAPFLEPMRKPALNLHQKYRDPHCPKCVQEAKIQAFKAVANAMTSLLVAEHAQTPNRLAAFKQAAGNILNMKVDQILVTYKQGGKDAVLQF